MVLRAQLSQGENESGMAAPAEMESIGGRE
jgi:hypothetical protein